MTRPALKYRIESGSFVGQVDTDDTGKIIATPPVWSKFKGLHLYRLTWWLTAKFTACQCVPMKEEMSDDASIPR